MRSILLGLMLAACGDEVTAARPDGAMPITPQDAGRRAGGGDTTVEPGDASGEWCGDVLVTGDVTVPAGATLTICAGSVVTFASGAAMRVQGTLLVRGTADRRVQLAGDGMWAGLFVNGSFEADFTDVYDADLAITGEAGSQIRFDDGLIFARTGGSLTLANGASLARSTIQFGRSIRVTGGTLSLTDSVVDFDHPRATPDCVLVAGGALSVDHSQIGNCHCPLHITAGGPVDVRDSILDGAAYPVMIAAVTAEIHGSHLLGSGASLQDIGGPFTANISGNDYGGDAPVLDTDDAAQFTGADQFEAAPIPGVGPR
ncbi:MAG: hypothetical protein IT378_21500 [Sandaracinaceae bacterium]|nr:hypothetical protein [Sandaracinaceae bacterium]